MSRRLVRTLRNISSTPAEIKTKNATSNDSFGPTTGELNDIALLSHDRSSLKDIISVLQKRLNNNSKNWRHVLKSLTVVQYVLLAGSSEFAEWFIQNRYLVSTLRAFQLQKQDEITLQITTKAKTIHTLLADRDLLGEKRSNFHIYRNKMSQPAKHHRSSLEIHRDSEGLRIVTDNIPLQFQRGSRSFEIRRSPDQPESPTTRLNKDQLEVSRLLADITEE